MNYEVNIKTIDLSRTGHVLEEAFKLMTVSKEFAEKLQIGEPVHYTNGTDSVTISLCAAKKMGVA